MTSHSFLCSFQLLLKTSGHLRVWRLLEVLDGKKPLVLYDPHYILGLLLAHLLYYFESWCFGGEGSALFFKNLLREVLGLHQAELYSCAHLCKFVMLSKAYQEDKKEKVVIKKFQVLYTRSAFDAVVWISWLTLFGFVPTIISGGQAQLGKEFISVSQTDLRHLPT